MRLTPALLMVALLAGCSALKPLDPGGWFNPPPALVHEDGDALLAYFDQIRTLPAAELAREHEHAKQRLAASKKDYHRLQLALLVSLPQAPFRDDSRALALLEPLARNPAAHASHRSFAALLQSQINERRRLGENNEALGAKLKETQQKLDALKSIEQSLSERDTLKGIKK